MFGFAGLDLVTSSGFADVSGFAVVSGLAPDPGAPPVTASPVAGVGSGEVTWASTPEIEVTTSSNEPLTTRTPDITTTVPRVRAIAYWARA